MSKTQKLAVFVTTIVVILVLILISREGGRAPSEIVPGDEALGEAQAVVRVTEVTPLPSPQVASDATVQINVGGQEQPGASPSPAVVLGAVPPVSPAPVQPPAAQIYTVAKGDTLIAIAEKVYGDRTKWKAIYEANRDRIVNEKLIHEGLRLSIPALSGQQSNVPPSLPMAEGRYHTVAKGDTLYKIAEREYGDASKWKLIYEANKSVLSSPGRLSVGQKLYIPPRSVASPD